ncbi:zinc-binding dehydrogenase [Pelomonas sp. SE-A7]|uniref:zinc-binding dehydrogenase n=1 Tax=Pelomonas sp. SE-A7 TaxID=3054953 RepID=UPI00259C795A|nr:zinc-binding dehydrogenase [Pelomonas sp. SE-A7]MDM4765046.1 zinc-binding dehydrogenase [Pelomonas sp. SE-A7]
MKAVVCQNQQLEVRELPEPIPEPGQVLVKVLRCGICGSDLHVRQHCDHWGQIMSRSGYHSLKSSAQAVVFGHEFSAEVLDYGPGTKPKLKPGTPVVALPFLRRGERIEALGLSEHCGGAYAERMLVQDSMMLAIPNGLDPRVAALTEPMAVAWHAVRRSELKKSDVAVVIGCGPVGLATICLLKAKGVKTVVASDFAPGRRALAKACGADVVLNPGEDSPFKDWKDWGCIGDLPGLLDLAMTTREQLGRLPVPWWQAWRLAEALGAVPKRPVVFECVGAPGVLQNLINGAPQMTRIVVVGVCMQPDQIEPAMAINKEIELRFVLGYSPLEFRDTLHAMADGKVRCEQLLTGEVGLAGVDAAFTALKDPNRHAKILIDPASSLTAPA